MKRPDNAGIRRRLVGSRTEAKANLAAVNVRNDSVVLVRIPWVTCKFWLPSVVTGVLPSEQRSKSVMTLARKNEPLTFGTNTNDAPDSGDHGDSLEMKCFSKNNRQINGHLHLQARPSESIWNIEEKLFLIASDERSQFNVQATRSAADERIGIPMAGILRLAKRRRPPLTPRPAKMYGPFF